jgi:CheY-like chemotaxis protein
VDWATVIAAAIGALGAVVAALVALLSRGRRRASDPSEEVDRPQPSRSPEELRVELDELRWRTAARRVLVVEDNEALARIVVQEVRGMRGADGGAFAAARVGTSDEALAAIGRDPPPDLWIVDLLLPGSLSGAAFVEELRTRTAGRPPAVLVVSAQASQRELDEIAAACGADAALSKPFELDALAAHVVLLCESRR